MDERRVDEKILEPLHHPRLAPQDLEDAARTHKRYTPSTTERKEEQEEVQEEVQTRSLLT